MKGPRWRGVVWSVAAKEMMAWVMQPVQPANWSFSTDGGIDSFVVGAWAQAALGRREGPRRKGATTGHFCVKRKGEACRRRKGADSGGTERQKLAGSTIYIYIDITYIMSRHGVGLAHVERGFGLEERSYFFLFIILVGCCLRTVGRGLRV